MVDAGERAQLVNNTGASVLSIDVCLNIRAGMLDSG
jgi:hypothetical protein